MSRIYERKYYLDLLKVISCFGVVLIHVISEFWYSLPVNSTDFSILSILDGLVRFCVPIYFMVSGALFLDENKKITIKELFKKRILKVFLIFFIWAVLYKIIFNIFVSNNNIDFSYIVSTVKNTLLGEGVFHLRFLVILLGFYICVPVLKLITKKENKKIVEYLIVILFIFSSVNSFSKTLFDISLSYPLVFSGNLLFFIIGYYLSTFELSKVKTNIVYILGVICCILTSFLTIKYSINMGKPNEIFYLYLSPNVVIYSSFIFLLFKNLYKKKEKSKNKVLSFMTKNYFGVYILHGFVLGICMKYEILSSINLSIRVMLLSVIIFITTFIISFIMGKIPVVKRLISM